MKTPKFNLNLIGFILSSCIILNACKKDTESAAGTPISTSEAIQIGTTSVTKGNPEGNQQTGANTDDILDLTSFNQLVKIDFSNLLVIENPLKDNGVNITVNGQHVVVNATASNVNYQITGTSSQGSLKVYSDKKFLITTQNLNLTNPSGSAINIQLKKRNFFYVPANSTCTLTDGATYATSTEDQKGTIFSEGQIILSGTGNLQVTGNFKHGIVSDDYIRVNDKLNLTVTAATDGLHANDAIYIDEGIIKITAKSDGIEAEEGHIIINGGTIQIQTTAGEGIESKSILTINGGNIQIVAQDDGINAGKAIYINDGLILVKSLGNDAVDSNGTLTITGGRIYAEGARAPEAGFDCDNSTFKITGGLIIGTGGSTSNPTSSVSTQVSLVSAGGNQNVVYSLIDKNNKEILTFKNNTSFATLLLSAPLLQGNTYRLVQVSEIQDATSTLGFYTAGKFTQSTLVHTYSLTSMVNSFGGSLGPGGGGNPGGR